MGNGKGNPEYYVAEIQPGKVLYEINGVPEQPRSRSLHAGCCKAAVEVAPSLPAKSAPEEEPMKASELRAKDVAALEKEGRRPAQGPLRPAHAKATQQLSNHSALGKTRRDIARAKTILAQKKKEAAK